jgi:hypothetical protein
MRRADAVRALSTDRAMKRYAHGILFRAISLGLLARGPCSVCGATEVEGHHNDYSHPLEVVWLCRIHHKEVHKK